MHMFYLKLIVMKTNLLNKYTNQYSIHGYHERWRLCARYQSGETMLARTNLYVCVLWMTGEYAISLYLIQEECLHTGILKQSICYAQCDNYFLLLLYIYTRQIRTKNLRTIELLWWTDGCLHPSEEWRSRIGINGNCKSRLPLKILVAYCLWVSLSWPWRIPYTGARGFKDGPTCQILFPGPFKAEPRTESWAKARIFEDHSSAIGFYGSR